MDRDGRNKIFDFFAAEHKKFKNYVQKRINDISDMDAEDIVGDVMLNMFNKADISEPIHNLASYVYRSLHNKVVDYKRKKSHTLSLQSYINDDGDTALIEFITDSSSNVSSQAEQNEYRKRILQAISNLKPHQRAIFIATEIKGLSFKELSEQWNEPMGTLLSRKCRALKALREMLKDLKE